MEKSNPNHRKAIGASIQNHAERCPHCGVETDGYETKNGQVMRTCGCPAKGVTVREAVRPVATDGGRELTRENYHQLTGFRRDILRTIYQLEASDEEAYGLAIKSGLESKYGDEVNHGRLYPNLDDLVNKGFVEKSELDKRTNEYALTTRARALLEGIVRSDANLVLDDYPTKPLARTDGGNGGDA